MNEDVTTVTNKKKSFFVRHTNAKFDVYIKTANKWELNKKICNNNNWAAKRSLR